MSTVLCLLDYFCNIQSVNGGYITQAVGTSIFLSSLFKWWDVITSQQNQYNVYQTKQHSMNGLS